MKRSYGKYRLRWRTQFTTATESIPDGERFSQVHSYQCSLVALITSNSQHDKQELVSEKPDCSNERLRGRALTRLHVLSPTRFRLLSSFLVKLDMRILMHKLFLNRCVI